MTTTSTTHLPLWRSCGGVVHCGAHFHAWIVIRAVRLAHHHKHRVLLGPARERAVSAFDDSLTGGRAVTATCIADRATVMPAIDGWTSHDIDDLQRVFPPEIADAAMDALELAARCEGAVFDGADADDVPAFNAPGGDA